MSSRPLPETSWKPENGWGYTLYLPDGRKFHRSGGMLTHADAREAALLEMSSGRYEKVWIYELTSVSNVVRLTKRPPQKPQKKVKPWQGSLI